MNGEADSVWTPIDAYPFKGKPHLAAVTYAMGDFYVIGRNIAILDATTHKWRLAGQLRNPRSSHGVIAISDSLLVIGGARASKTERCWRDDENETAMKCVELKTAPDGKMIRPTLVLVPSDYCVTAP